MTPNGKYPITAFQRQAPTGLERWQCFKCGAHGLGNHEALQDHEKRHPRWAKWMAIRLTRLARAIERRADRFWRVTR